MLAVDPRKKPVSEAEAIRLFAAFADLPKMALAVSGGSDSMALMLLMARWRRALRAGPDLLVLTVDHGLRAGSDEEARRVGRWADALGVRHEVLAWPGTKPRSNLQAEAREARYRLIAGACHRADIHVLASAHQLDDQAETVLLRLARGSGVDGLAAMEPSSRMMGLTLVRPLLDMPGSRLIASLEAAGQAWVEDPSNEDTRFARVRVRALMPALADEGLTPDRLAATARRMRRARAALETTTDTLAERAAALDPAGFCTLARSELIAAPEEIALRLLARSLMAVGGDVYRPRAERLERLYQRLAGGETGNWTLAGCRVSANAKAIVIWRESGRQGLPSIALKPGECALWDGRYRVCLNQAAPGPVTVRALGGDGWSQLRKIKREKLPISGHLGRTCVSFWRGGRLVWVPHLGQSGAAAQTCRAEFIGTIGAVAGNRTGSGRGEKRHQPAHAPAKPRAR